jgi:hypothetical protein
LNKSSWMWNGTDQSKFYTIELVNMKLRDLKGYMYKLDHRCLHTDTVTASIRSNNTHDTESLTDLFWKQISALDFIRVI